MRGNGGGVSLRRLRRSLTNDTSLSQTKRGLQGLDFWGRMGYYDGVAHGKWWLRTFHDAGAPLEHRGSSDRADATYHARGVRLPGRFYSGLL